MNWEMLAGYFFGAFFGVMLFGCFWFVFKFICEAVDQIANSRRSGKNIIEIKSTLTRKEETHGSRKV